MVNEINSMTLYKFNWGMSGWSEEPNEVWNMTPKIQRAAPLIVKQLFDVVTNQYNFPSFQNVFEYNNTQYFWKCADVSQLFLSLVTTSLTIITVATLLVLQYWRHQRPATKFIPEIWMQGLCMRKR